MVELRLFPEERTLRGKGASQQFLLMGRLADGRHQDVTDRASFSLTDPAVARLEGRGHIVATADGNTEVKAVLGKLEVSSRLRVEESNWVRPFHFGADVVSILTRQGCNQRACHAGVKGQGGFKLSVNGAHPREDYQWIVRGGIYQVLTGEPGEPVVSRINPEKPQDSLLVQKPTLDIPHRGGRRIDKASPEYSALVEWIRRGGRYQEPGESDPTKILRLEVYPQEAILQKGERQQLVVSAYRSDGSVEDFTRRVRFDSNHGAVADLSPTGLLTARNAGETAILIRGAGHEILSSIGVVAERISYYPAVPQRNFIDEQIFAKLRKFNIVPSAVSGDAEFLRRICLDLTGRLPPVARVREFLADLDPDKREKLIESLLDSPESVDYWTFRFADLFRVAIFPVGINAKWTQAYWEWIRDAVERNGPYDAVARERLAAQGYSPASRHYLPYLKVPPPENMMGEQVRVFLGRRLDCAQCHDHPYESWTQDQFWGMTAPESVLTPGGGSQGFGRESTWWESQGLHSGVVGGRAQPGRYLGSQIEQLLSTHLHQRSRNPDLGTVAPAGPAYGQAGARSFRPVLWKRPSAGGALLGHRTPAQSGHAVPQPGLHRGQGNGPCQRVVSPRDRAALGEQPAIRGAFPIGLPGPGLRTNGGSRPLRRGLPGAQSEPAQITGS